MKISTKGIYGLKAMVDLAANYNKENVTLKSISERQGISEGYLEQIFSILRKNELVKGQKGQGGGYIITKPLYNITVGDVLRVLEGKMIVVEHDKCKDKLGSCLEESVWDKINTSIDNAIDKITLDELVEKYNTQDEGYMFYI